MAAVDPPHLAIDHAEMRACIAAQRCPWCGKAGLRSLANHTVKVHQIYARELRELAGLPANAPLCAPELSERHGELAREHDFRQWLHRPEVFAASAATREANFDDERRRRRAEHLDAVRAAANAAFQRWLAEERGDAELAAARKIARSQAHRVERAGVECPICGAWFCSYVPVGERYPQRKYCSETCRSEARRRTMVRTRMRRLEDEQRSSSNRRAS
jgi:hypothetical protein